MVDSFECIKHLKQQTNYKHNDYKTCKTLKLVTKRLKTCLILSYSYPYFDTLLVLFLDAYEFY